MSELRTRINLGVRGKILAIALLGLLSIGAVAWSGFAGFSSLSAAGTELADMDAMRSDLGDVRFNS